MASIAPPSSTASPIPALFPCSLLATFSHLSPSVASTSLTFSPSAINRCPSVSESQLPYSLSSDLPLLSLPPSSFLQPLHVTPSLPFCHVPTLPPSLPTLSLPSPLLLLLSAHHPRLITLPPPYPCHLGTSKPFICAPFIPRTLANCHPSFLCRVPRPALLLSLSLSLSHPFLPPSQCTHSLILPPFHPPASDALAIVPWSSPPLQASPNSSASFPSTFRQRISSPPRKKSNPFDSLDDAFASLGEGSIPNPISPKDGGGPVSPQPLRQYLYPVLATSPLLLPLESLYLSRLPSPIPVPPLLFPLLSLLSLQPPPSRLRLLFFSPCRPLIPPPHGASSLCPLSPPHRCNPLSHALSPFPFFFTFPFL
ncbi:hypothetical protein AMTRI_Chr05g65870 [Amborella trichopoda]